jgi:DNA invertase Pin-like site-specific DNA recombinase
VNDLQVQLGPDLFSQFLHVEATAVHHIGKEANRWEEQFYLGFDEEEQIEYGVAPEESKKAFEALKTNIQKAGQREIARESGISRRTLSRLMQDKNMRKEIIARIVTALRDTIRSREKKCLPSRRYE